MTAYRQQRIERSAKYAWLEQSLRWSIDAGLIRDGHDDIDIEHVALHLPPQAGVDCEVRTKTPTVLHVEAAHVRAGPGGIERPTVLLRRGIDIRLVADTRYASRQYVIEVLSGCDIRGIDAWQRGAVEDRRRRIARRCTDGIRRIVDGLSRIVPIGPAVGSAHSKGMTPAIHGRR